MNAPEDAASHSSGAVFRLQGITKRFGATEALRGVDLSLQRGEFVALLGPNGAGKSTLIKVLDGVEQPDSGTVDIVHADALGIVHQDLGLVDELTVAENLFFGSRGFWLRPGRESQATAEALERVGVEHLHPHRLVSTLSLGERTMLAMAKLLRRGAEVVIVDEVTAGLPTDDARQLVRMLRDAAHRGTTVMMVTHRLREVEGIADRYVVMKDGRVDHDGPAADTTFDQLVALMIGDGGTVPGGQDNAAVGSAGPMSRADDEIVCRLKSIRVAHVGPIDVDMYAGTIVGLTGTLGSGIHEVAYVMAGLLMPVAGDVTVRSGTRRSCVPAHRETEGTFPDESEEFNLSAGRWRRWRSPVGLLRLKAMRLDCETVARQLDIRPADLSTPVGRLSGGNQQKTVLGRALIDQPDLLVLCEPTRGVDVATRQEIYHQVRAAAAGGAAVFVASSDLEDLASLADRTGLLGSNGQIERWVEGSDVGALSAELI